MNKLKLLDKRLITSVLDQFAFSILLALPLILSKVSDSYNTLGFSMNLQSGLIISLIGAFFSQPLLIFNSSGYANGIKFLKFYAILVLMIYVGSYFFELDPKLLFFYTVSAGFFEICRRIAMIHDHVIVVICEIIMLISILTFASLNDFLIYNYLYLFYIGGSLFLLFRVKLDWTKREDRPLADYVRMGSGLVAGTVLFWIQTGGFLILVVGSNQVDIRLGMTIFSIVSLMFGAIDMRFLKDSRRFDVKQSNPFLLAFFGFISFLGTIVYFVTHDLFLSISGSLLFYFIAASRIMSINLKKSGNSAIVLQYSYVSLILSSICLLIIKNPYLFMAFSGIISFIVTKVFVSIAENRSKVIEYD